GSVQAMEAIKILLGAGRTLAGRLLVFDALEMTWREVTLRRNPECPVCGDRPTQTELIDYAVFCGVAPAGASAAEGEAGRSGPVETLDAAELARRLDADPAPFLLDVRQPWEWSVGNLAERGARLVPLDELEERLAEVPRDRPVVVYCKSGGRSARAAALLVERGYGPVAHLEGGLTAWAEHS